MRTERKVQILEKLARDQVMSATTEGAQAKSIARKRAADKLRDKHAKTMGANLHFLGRVGPNDLRTSKKKNLRVNLAGLK